MLLDPVVEVCAVLARTLASAFILTSSMCAQAPVAANSGPSPAITANAAAPNHPMPTATSSPTAPQALALPPGKPTLLGGKVAKVDHVRDRLLLEPYGGGRTTVLFDERTRVIRNGRPASVDDLRAGQRVYVDTVLDGTDIFAQTVRLADAPAGQINGQIVSFEASSGKLTLRDALSPEQVVVRVKPGTTIRRGDRADTLGDLVRGTLVSLSFTPGSTGTPEVTSISLLASPGAAFVFTGRIEHLDLHRGLLVVLDPRDNQTYEVSIGESMRRLTQNLRQGTDVTVQTTFDGVHYQARDITINSPANR